MTLQPGASSADWLIEHYGNPARVPPDDHNRFRMEDESRPVAVAIDASVRSPILYGGEEQVLFLEVTTASGAPVAGVDVTTVVNYQGRRSEAPFGRTNEQGALSGVLPLPAFEPGNEVDVTINAYTEDGEFLGKQSLSFKTWW